VQTRNTRDLTTICTAFFFAFLGAGACQPFVVSCLTEQKGLLLGRASLVLATVYFTFGVFRFFIGFIVDRVGLHLSKILGVAAYALFPLVIWQGGSLPVFLLGSVVWGIGAPMMWTGAMVQILNTAPPTRYGTQTGILRGTVTLAASLGAYLLAFVYDLRGYDALFAVAAALGVIGILAMMISPNRRFQPAKPDLQTFFRLIRSRQAQAVMMFLVCSGLAYGVLLNGFKSHIETRCGSDWLRTILPVFFVAGILANFLGGWICDRIGRWPTFAGGFALGTVGMMLAWRFSHPVVLMLAMLLIGVEFAIVPLSAFAWIGDRTPPAERASVMGYVFCFRDVGIALAIQLRSLISDVATASLVFAVISAFCALVGAVVAVGLARRND